VTIGIIGGGIAGLATAIALGKIGKQAAVYERADEFREVGAGLQIGPNAVSALKQLGAFEALEPTLFSPQNIRIMDGLTGKGLTTLPLGNHFVDYFGQPYRVAHRADLLAALLETAQNDKNIELNLSRALKRLDIEPDSNICHFSDGQTKTHQTLIGADGFRSVTRRAVLNDGPPVFAGQTLYRALLDINEVPDIANVMDVHLWLYPHAHVVHYPVSAGKKFNIVAAVEQNWEQQGWSTPAEPHEVLSCYPKAGTDMATILAAPPQWLKWAAAGHPFSPVWHKHGATLIGDAIHPTLPYFAQGAAMALEDAVWLAFTHKNGGGFSAYARERQPRTKKIVETSTRLGKIYHMSNPGRMARNLIIANASTHRQYKQLEWLYQWQAPELQP
jgi:salicylate hydroxylase